MAKKCTVRKQPKCAGRKGGLATLRKHGKKFFARIGRKGGKA